MKLHAPAAARNREAIAAVLAEWLPPAGLVLEVASGSGEHALAFARRFPALAWQPSDPDPAARSSIAAWRAGEGPANLREPLDLDVASAEWPIDRADAVLAINLAHIAPWTATRGLLAGAARLLAGGAPLIFYGPWLADDIATAPSNRAFDADLRRRDPRWGLRRVEELAVAAAAAGFDLAERRAMPANNLVLLLRRA